MFRICVTRHQRAISYVNQEILGSPTPERSAHRGSLRTTGASPQTRGNITRRLTSPSRHCS
jgi:hypothetical protein